MSKQTHENSQNTKMKTALPKKSAGGAVVSILQVVRGV